MGITRREFTKKLGGIGLAAALGGCAGGAGEPSTRETDATQEFAQQSTLPHPPKGSRKLGNTELLLSIVGFGAQRTNDPDLIRYALDQGMNHIETAWGYGFGKPGNNCECVGKAVAGRRDSVCLSVAYEAGAPPESKAWLPNQFEQTLRDLGTDHVDLFLWHHPQVTMNNRSWALDENMALVTSGDRVDLMLKWKQEGKIRWCGITTHSEQEAWLRLVSDSTLYDVAIVAFNYKSPKGVAAAMEHAAQQGVGLIAMKTQSPNYLKGTVLGDAPDHRKALEWVLTKNYITAAIPGMTTREQVDLDVSVMRSL